MVGNNTPIFFVRDPMKFQHFIRSQKRRGDNGLRDHDMQWDFWTLSPESAHMVTWLMGDRGIPKTYRYMNGYSSHTYMWVNADGDKFWVKYHFKTNQGIECLTQDEADRLAGESPDYHRQDLFEAIREGDFPSWMLYMQIMPFDEARNYRFNPFDLTKVWPHGDYPLIKVGTMTLNRNLTDFHTEMEQAAFEPNNLVPGIGLSPDKMLLARGFSYADAHRAQLGQLQTDPGQFTPRARPQLQQGRRDAIGQRHRSRLRPQLLRGPESRPVPTDQADYGPATVTWSARPTRRGPPMTTSSKPARRCARYSTRTLASAWCRTSLVISPTASPTRCWRARSSTGRTLTRSSAIASSKPSVPASRPKPQAGPRQESRGVALRRLPAPGVRRGSAELQFDLQLVVNRDAVLADQGDGGLGHRPRVAAEQRAFNP